MNIIVAVDENWAIGCRGRVTFTSDTLRKYFPKSYTPQRMQETIIKLLEAWQKKRQRDQER